MEFLGIGPLELFAIIIVALIFLGPRDMVKAGRTLGKFLRSVVTSPTWAAIRQTGRTIKTLPTTLMREAGADEIAADLKQVSSDLNKQTAMLQSLKNQTGREIKQGLNSAGEELSAWTTPAPPAGPSIAPPNISTRPPGYASEPPIIVPTPEEGGAAVYPAPPAAAAPDPVRTTVYPAPGAIPKPAANPATPPPASSPPAEGGAAIFPSTTIPSTGADASPASASSTGDLPPMPDAP